MPTYGEKWRARSSACDTGHVPRSCPTTLLRLDSTGEISSVDNNTRPGRTQFNSTPTTEVNGNMINMKNWVASSVFGCNGFRSATNLTSSGKCNTNTDLNANILDRIADSMPGTPVNTMNPNMPKGPNSFPHPQRVFPGWNFNGQGFGVPVLNGRLPMFPCHQFPNPFVSPVGVFPYQGNMDMFANPEYLFKTGKWTKPQMMDDQYWHQRHPKCDRSYRGHAPKHHKHEHVRHDKKMSPTEQVPSKCHGKRKQHCKGMQVKMEDKPGGAHVTDNQKAEPQSCKSKCTNAASKVETNTNCTMQVKPDVVQSCTMSSECDNNNSSSNGCDKLELKAPVRKLHSKDGELTPSDGKNGVCEMSQDLDTMVTVNITKSCASSTQEASSLKSEGPDQNDNRQESNIHVLFVRKNWKKGRPSSSKQRRRKLQKAKSASCSGSTVNSIDSEQVVTDAPKSESSKDEKKSRCSGTVSFILGLAQSPTSPNMPNCGSSNSSFVFSISDDDSGDFESDGDNDEDWEADFTDFAPCNLFNFLPNSNKESTSPLNFQVHITPVQNGLNTQTKTMEDINSSWNVQISVRDDCSKQKKKTSKKVHFPEDKDLSVVHPMVTWSYAYKAARKGHWENFVRDRDRFRRRVQDLESVLNPVLDCNHRDLVYKKLSEAQACN